MFYLSLILNHQHSSIATTTMSNKRPRAAVQRATKTTKTTTTYLNEVEQHSDNVTLQRRRRRGHAARRDTLDRRRRVLRAKLVQHRLRRCLSCRPSSVLLACRRVPSAWMASECKRAGGRAGGLLFVFIFTFIILYFRCPFSPFSARLGTTRLVKTATKARDATLLLQGRRARVRRVAALCVPAMSKVLLCVQRRLTGWLRCAQSRVAGGRAKSDAKTHTFFCRASHQQRRAQRRAAAEHGRRRLAHGCGGHCEGARRARRAAACRRRRKRPRCR